MHQSATRDIHKKPYLLNSRVKREKIYIYIYLLHDVFPSFDNTIISSPLLGVYFSLADLLHDWAEWVQCITSVSASKLFVSRLAFPSWEVVAIKMEYNIQCILCSVILE